MKKTVLLLSLFTGVLLSAAPQKLKPFRLQLDPKQDTYIITPKQSGVFWIVSSTKAKIPVGVQHFATMKWDGQLPMYRRLLQSNQVQKDMPLDRIIFQAGKKRTLKITYDQSISEISRLTFTPDVPVKVPADAQNYVPPIKPPARHPRVLVNPAVLAQIKKNLTKEENLPAWKLVQKTALQPFELKIHPEKELQFNGRVVQATTQKAFYYLMTGDAGIGREAIDLICKYMQNVAFGNGQDICRKVGESIYAASLVYDWCYPLLSRKEKDLLRERMLYFAAEMETGWPAFRQSAASGHGNEAQISRDLLAMAIAIYNEDPVPYKYIHYQMMENLKDIKHHLYQSGRHDQGTNYGQYRSSWDFFAALQHKRTFHYDLLPQEAGILPYYWYYLRLPDGRFTAEGDTNWIWTPAYAQINSSLLLAAVALYRDPELKMELKRKNWKNAQSDPVFFLLTNDPDLQAVDRRGELPLAKHYRSPLPGLAVRTGWNFSPVADDAVITMNGAEYHFRNHQHLDMGSFQIYYRGNLVSDLGQYRIYGVPYDYNLAKSSALHSLMRFHDPAQKKWSQNSRITVNSGGQDVFSWGVPNNFKQLKAKEAIWKIGETPRSGSGPDAARPVYSFMESDLSLLYPNRAKAHTRTFVFLNQENNDRPGTLLILDRFETAKNTVIPIFQLTTIPKPEWKDGVLTAVTRQYGKIGKLTLTPLVPAKVNAKILTEKAAHTFDGIHIPARNPHQNEAKGSRTELTGAGNVFLNALQIHDGYVKALPVSVKEQNNRYTVDLDMSVEKTVCKGYLVSLGDTLRLTDKAFTITVPRDNMRVLILNLAPGAWNISGKNFAEVTPEKGSLFAVLNRGTYKVAPGKSGQMLQTSGIRARTTAPVQKNQLWLNGKTVQGVSTEVFQKQVLIPMTAFAKPVGNTLTVSNKTFRVTMKEGDTKLNCDGLEIALPRKLDKRFLLPVNLAAALAGYKAEAADVESGLAMLSHAEDATSSKIMLVTASEAADNLHAMLTRRQGDWIAHGRKSWAEIIFTAPQKLSGMVFTWPHGARRRAFWQVDVSSDGKVFETVFDGESTARQLESTIKFTPRKVRVIRLYMKGNSENTWNTLGMLDFLQ
ncbi:MAG: discoidin domain-containing protein [Lentisphaeria bacterium]|nr:discoidin domain-containing protein [Lentisphaeria bacterium]